MNEIKFKDIGNIENYKIRFKCFDGPDGYQATFHVYDKLKSETHYQIDFFISGTQYNSDFNGSGELTKDYINGKFGNIENCFKQTGIKYIKKKIKANNCQNVTVNIFNLNLI